jgi:regulator of protease activity HflC (stomatin/prohibitin superfamily)
MKTKEEIFTGIKLPGIPMLLFNILLSLAIIGAFVCLVIAADSASLSTALIVVCSILLALLFIFNMIAWAGFMQIEPNEARVLIFFGKYEGTVKENGFFWVNPFYTKKDLTLRARNLDAQPIKVNDKKGNPVSIGQVVVWRVADTYKASFNIDTTSQAKVSVSPQPPVVRLLETRLLDKMKAYENFVKVQSDAALRYVAGMFAYDHSENEDEKLTLRSGGQEINDILEKQLTERMVISGIEIVEARVNYLAYAPEIAAVMLRRQQADAIISAREKIVDGAVGMVKHALKKLSEEAVIELDDDKKAAMVSNLLVVLCSDEHAQPVINTGTLHN